MNINVAFMNILNRFPDKDAIKEYSGKTQEQIENILKQSDEFAINNRKHVEFEKFMKQQLKKIKNKCFTCAETSDSCAFIAEGRKHKDIQVVVKRVLQNIPRSWCLEIVCTNENLEFLQKELSTCSSIKFNTVEELNNMNDYNNLMLSIDFWNWLKTRYVNILIFQTDVIMLKPLPLEMMTHQYIGAPCIEKTHMNGGFSFRKIQSMINVLEKNIPHPNEEEDKFFCKHLPKIDFETARRFSSEHIPSNDIPIGLHKTWIYNPSYFKYLASIIS